MFSCLLLEPSVGRHFVQAAAMVQSAVLRELHYCTGPAVPWHPAAHLLHPRLLCCIAEPCEELLAHGTELLSCSAPDPGPLTQGQHTGSPTACCPPSSWQPCSCSWPSVLSLQQGFLMAVCLIAGMKMRYTMT